MKRGTKMQRITLEEYSKFVSTLISQLWEVVEEMEPSMVKFYSNHPIEVGKALKKGFKKSMGGQPSYEISQVYMSDVDYDLRLEDDIMDSLCKSVHPMINNINFGTVREGKGSIGISFFTFDGPCSLQYIRNVMKKEGYRSVELIEPLSLPEKYPEKIKQYLPMAILGSVHKDQNGDKFIASIKFNGGEYFIGIVYLDSEWDEEFSFPVVKEHDKGN